MKKLYIIVQCISGHSQIQLIYSTHALTLPSYHRHSKLSSLEYLCLCHLTSTYLHVTSHYIPDITHIIQLTILLLGGRNTLLFKSKNNKIDVIRKGSLVGTYINAHMYICCNLADLCAYNWGCAVTYM